MAGAVFTSDIRKENLRNRLAVEFLVSFMDYYQAFPARNYLEEYRKRSFVIGKRVHIMPPSHGERRAAQASGENREYGLVLGIDDACHLKVRYDDGTIEFLSSGEISIRMDGAEGHRDSFCREG